MTDARERVLSLRQRIENGEEIQVSISELKDILSADCAELDKASAA